MTDIDNIGPAELEIPSELDSLKAKAKTMGIKHHPSIGVEKLKAKIEEHVAALEKTPEAPAKIKPVVRSARAALKREQLVLVRIRVTAMNPQMKGLKGQYFAVANGLVGTVKKYIPFDSPYGWHVPEILVNELESKQYQTFFYPYLR